jgi:hypothetical protein
MTSFYKNKIILLLVLFICAPRFLSAQSPVVSDPTNLVQNTLSAISEMWQVTKDMGLDPVVYQLAAMAGNKMSNAVFNNAGGGASGDRESQVISNFTDVLQKVDDREKTKFIAALEADSDINPFAQKIAKKFSRDMQKETGPGGAPVSKFNLDKVIGPNWKQFSTDARVGGWDGYIASAFPENNPYGAQNIASEELSRRIASQREAEKLKLTSPGINPSASSTQCGLRFADYQRQIGGVSAKRLTKNLALNAQIQGKIDSANNRLDKLDKNDDDYETSKSLIEEEIAKLQKQLPSGAELQTEKNKMQVEGNISNECIEEIIQNPVTTAASLLDSAATYGITKSQNAQGAGDFFLTIFMSMAQSFLRGGLSSFQNQGNKYLRPIDPSIIGGPEDQVDAYGNTKPFNEQPFQVVDLASDFPHAYRLTKEDIEKTGKALQELRKTPNILGNLDICIPGPDYKYNERFEKYYQEKLQIPYGVYARAEEDWERAREEAKIKDLEYSKRLAVSEMKSIVNDPAYNIPGSTIFKSAVSEFGNKKIAFDQNRRSLIEKNAAISVILSIGQRIKYTLAKIASFERNILFFESANMEQDTIVVSSQDWKMLESDTKKQELVKWAKCFEMPKQTWDTLTETQKKSPQYATYTECF